MSPETRRDVHNAIGFIVNLAWFMVSVALAALAMAFDLGVLGVAAGLWLAVSSHWALRFLRLLTSPPARPVITTTITITGRD